MCGLSRAYAQVPVTDGARRNGREVQVSDPKYEVRRI
jgi:hypothetical protein